MLEKTPHLNNWSHSWWEVVARYASLYFPRMALSGALYVHSLHILQGIVWDSVTGSIRGAQELWLVAFHSIWDGCIEHMLDHMSCLMLSLCLLSDLNQNTPSLPWKERSVCSPNIDKVSSQSQPPPKKRRTARGICIIWQGDPETADRFIGHVMTIETDEGPVRTVQCKPVWLKQALIY